MAERALNDNREQRDRAEAKAQVIFGTGLHTNKNRKQHKKLISKIKGLDPRCTQCPGT